MQEAELLLPAALDYSAAFLFALTGAIVAYEKDYDFTGMAAMALAVGLGGGLIRDGIFLQQVPAAVQDWRYLAAVAAAVVIAILIGDKIEKRVKLVILLLDAMGLGLYAAVGSSKALGSPVPLSVYAAALIGIINAIGGGLLRDVLSREDPIIFQPGQLYAVVAALGVTVFLVLGVGFDTPAWVAAVACVAVTFVTRILTLSFDIRTSPVRAHAWRTRTKRGVDRGIKRIRRRV